MMRALTPKELRDALELQAENKANDVAHLKAVYGDWSPEHLHAQRLAMAAEDALRAQQQLVDLRKEEVPA